MAAGILGLIVVAACALILAAPPASRRLRSIRAARTAGGPPACPAPQPAGRAAVPEAQPRMTEPFAYTNGLTIEQEDTS
jgi:hypothetical protein